MSNDRAPVLDFAAGPVVRRHGEGDAMPEPAHERDLEELLELARVRFGASRAEALRPELEALAAEVARVAEAELPDDGEPGFLMLED
jgi:plasmid stabilization system protein ParE